MHDLNSCIQPSYIYHRLCFLEYSHCWSMIGRAVHSSYLRLFSSWICHVFMLVCQFLNFSASLSLLLQKRQMGNHLWRSLCQPERLHILQRIIWSLLTVILMITHSSRKVWRKEMEVVSILINSGNFQSEDPHWHDLKHLQDCTCETTVLQLLKTV